MGAGARTDVCRCFRPPDVIYPLKIKRRRRSRRLFCRCFNSGRKRERERAEHESQAEEQFHANRCQRNFVDGKTICRTVGFSCKRIP